MSYAKLTCTPRVFFAAVTGLIDYLCYCVFEPTLSLRLEDYELSVTYQGLVFAIMPLMYMIGTIITPFAIPKWIEIRVTLIIGSILLGGSILLVGPVYEDTNLVVMLVGLFLSGAFLGPIMIPNMAEMMIATKVKYPDSDLEHANSLLSGILNCCYGMG